MTKQEFLNAVSILNASKITIKTVATDKKEETQQPHVCVTFSCNYDDCVECSRPVAPHTTNDNHTVTENDDYDDDFEMLDEILSCSDAETWKEFVYDVIEEGYTCIPSWKIAEFIREEFGVSVSAASVAAVKANANR